MMSSTINASSLKACVHVPQPPSFHLVRAHHAPGRHQSLVQPPSKCSHSAPSHSHRWRDLSHASDHIISVAKKSGKDKMDQAYLLCQQCFRKMFKWPLPLQLYRSNRTPKQIDHTTRLPMYFPNTHTPLHLGPRRSDTRCLRGPGFHVSRQPLAWRTSCRHQTQTA